MALATAPAPPTSKPKETWEHHAPEVRKALKWVRSRKGKVTTEELVDWDATHGRHLFTWNDAEAGEHWRKLEARQFFTRFRAMFDGMRVRAFYNLPTKEDPAQRAYFPVEEIAGDPDLRGAVIGTLTRKLAALASELRMWKLSPDEQADLFERLRVAMGEA